MFQRTPVLNDELIAKLKGICDAADAAHRSPDGKPADADIKFQAFDLARDLGARLDRGRSYLQPHEIRALQQILRAGRKYQS